MSHGWRALMMFGGGTLFGVVLGGVLYAPPELANQPPPWELWARAAAGPAAATRVAGAGPARPLVPAAAATPPVAAVPPIAAPEPIAAAAAPAAVEAAPAAAAVAASAPVVVAASRPSNAPRRKVRTEEPADDPAALPPQPRREAIRVAPEPLPAPVEAAPARAEGEPYDAAR